MGYLGDVWLVAILLALTLGLASALYMATRGTDAQPVRARRTR
jgi:hypothetical protein